MRRFSLPAVSLPAVSLPGVSLPAVSLPAVSLAVSLLAVSVLAPVPAPRAVAQDAPPASAEIATPEGRIDLTVEGGPRGDGGFVRAHGNVGAYHLDNTAEGGPSGGRVTNPPMWGALGTEGEERPELYGPPVARASLGTGGLTAGLAGTGVLTNLGWPGPGFYDQVDYLHRTRGWPNGGAAENAGSFGGLLLPDGSATWFTELEGWETIEQAYAGPDSGVLVTVLRHDELGDAGVEVTIRDVVHPTDDVLARHFEVTGAPDGTRLTYYANMNPTATRTPRVPSTTDALLDDASDFATVYERSTGAMLHFRPARVDPAATTAAVTGRLSEENTAAAVDRSFGTGVYVAIGGEQRPTGFQAGLDSSGLVRGEAEGTPLLDPFEDARDGSFSGSVAAAGRTAGAQAWDGVAGTVYLTAADSAAGALDLVAEARDTGHEGIERASDEDWAEWVDDLRLPDSSDGTVRTVTQRALMLIRTAQDRETGAIVANTTTQTPYRQDWLRDGAFFNYALLVAGTEETLEMVRAHNDFYRRYQSESGHWDPILCTDGAHCDAAFPFEIDAQAFGVWSLWSEYEFTGDRERLEQSYEAIRKGAEVLWACQDPSTGLQCYASEDDHPDPSQGAQGASTVYLGLRSAAEAARLVDVEGSDEDAARWDRRADELESAATEAFCSETCETGRWYMFWPSRLLDPADDHTQATLDGAAETLARRIAFELPEEQGFFQYPMEPMFGLATAWRDPGASDLLEDGVRWLTHDVAEPGVHHFGERIFHLGDGEYLHSVGFPHIWSGTETYLAAALSLGVEGCEASEVADGERCPIEGGGDGDRGRGGGAPESPGRPDEPGGERSRGQGPDEASDGAGRPG